MSKSTKAAVEKLVFGGYGLARTDRGVLLVEGALPGEIVETEPAGTRGGVNVAKCKTVLEASPKRRDPPCPYFDRCGGCDWQHMTYDQQLLSKKEIVVDCFERIGKIGQLPEIAVNPSPEWAYRCRTQIKLDRPESLLGFYRKKTNSVVGIEHCPLLVQSLNTILEKQAYVLANTPQDTYQIRAVSSSEGHIASSPVIKNMTENQISIRVGRGIFLVSGGSFFQGNIFLLEKLGSWARGMVGGNFFVDMFGGAGLFSVMLGDLFTRGVLVETLSDLAELANRNLHANRMSHIHAEAVSGEDFFKIAAHSRYPRPDCIMVDPPRPGLSRAVREGICGMRPKTVVYVSCNPSTQARDVGFLTSKCGYSIEHVELFDLYPQTHHVETGLILRLE